MTVEISSPQFLWLSSVWNTIKISGRYTTSDYLNKSCGFSTGDIWRQFIVVFIFCLIIEKQNKYIIIYSLSLFIYFTMQDEHRCNKNVSLKYAYHSWQTTLDTSNAFNSRTIQKIDDINITNPPCFSFTFPSGIESILNSLLSIHSWYEMKVSPLNRQQRE